MQTRPRGAAAALALALAFAFALQPVAAHLGVEPVDTVIGSALPCADPGLGYERGCETWTDAYVGMGHADELATSVATGGGLVVAAGFVEPNDLLVAAYDADDGAARWTVREPSFGAGVPRAAVRADGALAAVTASDSSRTVVFSFAADGAPAWNATEDGPGDAVALFAAGGGFILVRNAVPHGIARTEVVRYAADGAVAWRTAVGGVTVAVAARDAALSADGARLAVVGASADDAHVALLDTAAGGVLWTQTWDLALGSDAAETVAIGPSVVVVGVTTFPTGIVEPDASVLAFVLADGAPSWSHTFAAPANGSTAASAVAVTSDGAVAFAVVNLSDPYSGDVSGDWLLGYAADGTPRWARELPAPSWYGIPERFLASTASGFALVRSVGYGGYDTELRVLDAAAGTDVSVAQWDGPGYSGDVAEVAFDGGRAFLGGALGAGWARRDLLVLAWDLGAPAPAWSATHDTPAPTAEDSAAGNALSADGARLYTALTTEGEDRARDVIVRALDPATGALAWERRYAGAEGTTQTAHAVHAGGDDVVLVVATAWDGGPKLRLFALDGATGDEVWTRELPAGPLAFLDATASSDDMLIVSLGRWVAGYTDIQLDLLAFSTDDGADVWSTTWNATGPLEETAYGLAVTSDVVALAGVAYAGGTHAVGVAAAFDASDGTRLWERVEGSGLRSVAAVGTSVFVAGARGQDALVAAFAADGAPLWNATVDRSGAEVFTGVVVSPDGAVVHAAGATDTHLLVAAFDADDGDVRHVRANDVFPNWPGASFLAVSADGSRLATASGGTELVTTVLDAADGKMLAAAIVQDGHAVARGVAVTGDSAFTTASIRRAGTGNDAVTVAYAADDANALPWWALT